MLEELESGRGPERAAQLGERTIRARDGAHCETDHPGVERGVPEWERLPVSYDEQHRRARRAALELAVFRRTLRDQPVNVSFVRPAPATGQFQALVNAAEVKQSSVEAGAQLVLTSALTLAGTYTYSDFTYDRYAAGATDFTGKELPGIPKHNGFAELRYCDGRGLTRGVEVQSVGEFYVNDANTETNAAYRVVNLRAGWERAVGATQLAPFVAVNNVFGEEYSSQPQINAAFGRFFNPLPGVTCTAGLKLTW